MHKGRHTRIHITNVLNIGIYNNLFNKILKAFLLGVKPVLFILILC